MDEALPASAERVQRALAAAGVAARVSSSTWRRAPSQQAADALGIAVGQIAKSLIFRAAQTGRAVLVIAAGDRRVDEATDRAPRRRADRACANRRSCATIRGFAIGGVAPLAHARPMVTFVDASLRRFDDGLGRRRHAALRVPDHCR